MARDALRVLPRFSAFGGGYAPALDETELVALAHDAADRVRVALAGDAGQDHVRYGVATLLRLAARLEVDHRR